MKFYADMKLLYLETDASRVGLGAGWLQTREGTSCPWDMAHDNIILRPCAFASESLSALEKRYNSIGREALGILHSLETFFHYCFAREMSIITDHKPIVAFFEKGVATLSQGLECILLRIDQYRVRIINKCGPVLFIAGWLSRQNHKENKDGEKLGMKISSDAIHTAIEIPYCMTIQKYNRWHQRWLPTTVRRTYHERPAQKQKWGTMRNKIVFFI